MSPRRINFRSWALVAVALLAALPARGEDSATPPPGKRGGHLTFSLIGSELDAPRQTATTDLELFSGLGIGVAGGYRFGRFRLEGEFQTQLAERPFTGDTVRTRALMVNAYVDLPVTRRFGFFLGAGFGLADVDVEIETCLDLQGCPSGGIVDQGASASAQQYVVGAELSLSPGGGLFLAYRRFLTGTLGLTDSEGRGFSDDRVDMPTALFGYTLRF